MPTGSRGKEARGACLRAMRQRRANKFVKGEKGNLIQEELNRLLRAVEKGSDHETRRASVAKSECFGVEHQ